MARKAWPDYVSLDEPSRFCWLELSVCYMTDVGGLKAESKEISHIMTRNSQSIVSKTNTESCFIQY